LIRKAIDAKMLSDVRALANINNFEGRKMKIKKLWIVVTVLAICISVLWATNKYDPRDALKGLQGVRVLVEILEPEVEKSGLTTQQLQTDVELRLRQNGIRVLSEQEQLSTPGMPYLYVNVNIMIRKDIPLVQLAVYVISVKLKQNVFLARDTTKLCIASTWDSKGSNVGSVGLDKIETTIRKNIKDNVDEFINDYLAVNPKK